MKVVRRAWLLTLIGVALGPTVISVGCRSRSEDSLARISREKTIRVGYISYFDITFSDARTGETKGVLVDVLTEVLSDLGIDKDRITFVETDWQNFGLGLEAGKYDLSIAGTFNTPVRSQVVNFGRPIFHLGNGAVVRRDDDRFGRIEDFNREGVILAVVQGEQGYEYARKHLTKATLLALAGSDLSLAPLQVKLGHADAALSDQYILRRYTDRNSEVKDALADHPYDVLPICWSVSKRPTDDALLAYVNRRLDTLEQSGRLATILARYPMIPYARVQP